MDKFLTETLKDENLLHFLHYNEQIWNVPSFSEFIKEIQSKDFELITETKELKSLLELKYKGKVEASPLDNFFRDQRVIIPQILSDFGLMHSIENICITDLQTHESLLFRNVS